MNKNIFFGHNDLRFIYLRYKDSAYYSISLFALVILVSIILIFRVIIPQMETYFSVNQQAVELRSEIKAINDNINFINSLDKSQLNTQLQSATTALPIDKEFAGIINVIADSAIRSGVSVEDFSFSFADAKTSDKPGAGSDTEAKNLVPINMSIAVKGSINSQKKFLKEILEKIPLAEISSVDGDANALNANISFYYKPFSKVSFKDDEPIPPLSSNNSALLQKLSTWAVAPLNLNIIDSNGSSSATPLF